MALFQGNQILGNLSPDEYSRVIKVLEDAILSTDLAVYFRYWQISEDSVKFTDMKGKAYILSIFRKRGAFFNLVRTSSYNWSREDHRELLRGMTMTVCDLAAITKPWEVEKRVSTCCCPIRTINYKKTLWF